MEMAIGVFVVAVAGLLMGTAVWPMKLMRTLQFEHWWFIGMLFGLILVPWAVSFAVFPNLIPALRDTPISFLILSNAFSISWGIANILAGLCFVRIGVALTMAIVTGLGVSVASILPMIFKGSGLFSNSPSIMSSAGMTILCGIGVMLIGVALASLAGFGRDRELQKLEKTSGSFVGGLIMTIIAGLMSAGILLAFVYSQGPIVARVCMIENGQNISVSVSGDKEVSGDYQVAANGTILLKGKNGAPIVHYGREVAADGTTVKQGKREVGLIKVGGLNAKAASDLVAAELDVAQSDENPNVIIDTHNIFAILPVQAIGLLGGALLNVFYPCYLMTRRKSWGVLFDHWKEVGLASIIGIQMCVSAVLANKGMLLLGAIGASVGAGIQQAMQMVGGQGLGFISGEWRGVHGKPRNQMYLAIVFLIVAAIIMAYSNTLAN